MRPVPLRNFWLTQIWHWRRFLPEFILFPLLIIIPPFLHSYLLPPPEVCNNPHQAAHYYIFGGSVWDFISDPALGWLQSKE
jgi:hypothetical protein